MKIVDGEINDTFMSFISKDKYSRWIEEENRRETWEETVDRYCDYMRKRMDEKYPGVYRNKFWKKTRKAILNLEVMPSMRAMMMAGPGLDANEMSAYNCSAVAFDDVRAFDELMFILSSGTGAGFSVEKHHVDKLPDVPRELERVSDVVIVEDSREGWATAMRQYLEYLYDGKIPSLDITRVRPQGARLKTTGGTASGPQPLVDVIDFTINTFKNAKGRKLKPIEVHDIACKIGESIVSGGVRRSALISLSDLSDYDMSKAKSGNWWQDSPHRSLANNSAVYNERPSVGQFLQEWGSIYESHSGERGIFNMESARKGAHAPRRDTSKISGTNPCFTADTKLLTSSGWTTFGDAYKSGENQTIIQDTRVTYSPSEDGVEHPENWVVNKKHQPRGVFTEASHVFLTQEDADIVRVTTTSGLTMRVTPDHLVATKNRGMVRADELLVGEPVLVVNAPLPEDYGIVGDNPETVDEIEAYLMGMVAGDGTFVAGKDTQMAMIDLWGDDRNSLELVTNSIDKLWDIYGDTVVSGVRPYTKYTVVTDDSRNKIRVQSSFLAALLKGKYGFSRETKHVVPEALIEDARSRPALFYVSALFFCDGTVNKYNKVGSSSIRLNQSNKELLEGVNLILLANGIQARLYKRRDAKYTTLPDGSGGVAEYLTKENYESVIMMHTHEFTKYVGFLWSHKQPLAESMFKKSSNKKYVTDKVASVVEDGVEDVYCLKEDTRRTLVAGGIVARRCGEIYLRSSGLCNLSEVVVREDDTLETLLDKVEIATALGTIQSDFTNFHYVRDIWRENAEEERLLGVSLTGVFGNELMSGKKGKRALKNALTELRLHAIHTNKELANKMGINQSVAITTNKPSGTVSLLTYSASGLHPWHSHHYIRTIRANVNTPMAEFLKSQGVPHEPDVMKPDTGLVFSFPFKAPENAVVKSDITAVEHLDLWLMYKKHWTEHNPSVTIDYQPDEWFEIGAWVMENWDEVGGLSFLPASDHTYAQAPLQEISETDYNQWLSDSGFPETLDWDDLPLFETEDTTTGSKQLACVSGECSLVEIE